MSVAFGSFHFSSPWFRSDLTESDCWIWLQSSFFFGPYLYLVMLINCCYWVLLGFTGFLLDFIGFQVMDEVTLDDLTSTNGTSREIDGNFRWFFFRPLPPPNVCSRNFLFEPPVGLFICFFWKGGRAIPILFCLSVCVCVCVCTICGELKKITKTHRSETNPPLNGSDRKVHHLRWHQLPEWIDRFTTFRSRKKKRKEK